MDHEGFSGLSYPDQEKALYLFDGHNDEKLPVRPPWEGTVASRIRSLNDLNKSRKRNGLLPSGSNPQLLEPSTSPTRNYISVYESLDKVARGPAKESPGKRTNPFRRRGLEASSDNDGGPFLPEYPPPADNVIHSPTPRWLVTHPTFYRDRSPSPNAHVDQVLDDRGSFGGRQPGNYFAGANTSVPSGRQVSRAVSPSEKHPVLRHLDPFPKARGDELLRDSQSGPKGQDYLSATNPWGVKLKKGHGLDTKPKSMPSLRESGQDPEISQTPLVGLSGLSATTETYEEVRNSDDRQDTDFRYNAHVERTLSVDRPFQSIADHPSSLDPGDRFQYGGHKDKGHVEKAAANTRTVSKVTPGSWTEKYSIDQASDVRGLPDEHPSARLREHVTSPSIGLGPRNMTFGRTPKAPETPRVSVRRESLPVRPDRAIRPMREGIGVEQPALRASREGLNVQRSGLTPSARLPVPEIAVIPRTVSLEGLRKATPLKDQRPLRETIFSTTKPTLKSAPLKDREDTYVSYQPVSAEASTKPAGARLWAGGRITSLERTWKAERTDGNDYSLRETFVPAHSQPTPKSSPRQDEYSPSGFIARDYAFDAAPTRSVAQSTSSPQLRSMSPATDHNPSNHHTLAEKDIHIQPTAGPLRGVVHSAEHDPVIGEARNQTPVSTEQGGSAGHLRNVVDSAKRDSATGEASKQEPAPRKQDGSVRHRSSQLWSPTPKPTNDQSRLWSPKPNSTSECFDHQSRTAPSTTAPSKRERSAPVRGRRDRRSDSLVIMGKTGLDGQDHHKEIPPVARVGRLVGTPSQATQSDGAIKPYPSHFLGNDLPAESPMSCDAVGEDAAQRIFGWKSKIHSYRRAPGRFVGPEAAYERERVDGASLAVFGTRSVDVHVHTNDPSTKLRLGSAATVEGPGYIRHLIRRPLSPDQFFDCVRFNDEPQLLEDKSLPPPSPLQDMALEMGNITMTVQTSTISPQETHVSKLQPQISQSEERLRPLRSSTATRSSFHSSDHDNYKADRVTLGRPHLRRTIRKLPGDIASIDSIIKEHRKMLEEVTEKLQSSGPRLERLKSLSMEHLAAASDEETYADDREAEQSSARSSAGDTGPDDGSKDIELPPSIKDPPHLMRRRSKSIPALVHLVDDAANEFGLQLSDSNPTAAHKEPRSLPEMFDELQAIQQASDEIASSRDELRRVISEAAMTSSSELSPAQPSMSESKPLSVSRRVVYVPDDGIAVMHSHRGVLDRAKMLTPSPERDLDDGDDYFKLDDTEKKVALLLALHLDETYRDSNEMIPGSSMTQSPSPSPDILPSRPSLPASKTSSGSQRSVYAPYDDIADVDTSTTASQRPVSSVQQTPQELYKPHSSHPLQTSHSSPAEHPGYPVSPTTISTPLAEMTQNPDPDASTLLHPSSPPPTTTTPPSPTSSITPSSTPYNYIPTYAPDLPTPPPPAPRAPTPPQGIARQHTVRARILSLEEDSEGWEGGGGPTEQINRLKEPFW